MLPPYSAGSARSVLMRLLAEGHQGVRLSREDLDKIACWIDLLVPYCGDYREAHAWTSEERARYDYFLAKRARMEAQETANVALVAESRPAPSRVRRLRSRSSTRPARWRSRRPDRPPPAGSWSPSWNGPSALAIACACQAPRTWRSDWGRR